MVGVGRFCAGYEAERRGIEARYSMTRKYYPRLENSLGCLEKAMSLSLVVSFRSVRAKWNWQIEFSAVGLARQAMHTGSHSPGTDPECRESDGEAR